MSNQTQHPRYIRIAIDIANRIISGDLKENEKIKGRSTIAGEYNVSPETIRRSMALLSDMGVVEVIAQSGITIKSKKNSLDFINKFSSKENINSLKVNIKNLIEERNKLNTKIDKNIELIIEQAFSHKTTGIIQLYQYKVKKGSWVIGKMVSAVKFWHNTGATIIAFERDKEILVSPGPYFEFDKGDILIFVGNDNVNLRVKTFIETKPE